jgi:hypothetical protein
MVFDQFESAIVTTPKMTREDARQNSGTGLGLLLFEELSLQGRNFTVGESR